MFDSVDASPLEWILGVSRCGEAKIGEDIVHPNAPERTVWVVVGNCIPNIQYVAKDMMVVSSTKSPKHALHFRIIKSSIVSLEVEDYGIYFIRRWHRALYVVRIKTPDHALASSTKPLSVNLHGR
jgi:hypothetical protein